MAKENIVGSGEDLMSKMDDGMSAIVGYSHRITFAVLLILIIWILWMYWLAPEGMNNPPLLVQTSGGGQELSAGAPAINNEDKYGTESSFDDAWKLSLGYSGKKNKGENMITNPDKTDPMLMASLHGG